MSLGMILLVVISILVLFGVMQRVLDRMRLTDRQALMIVAAIFVGGLLPDIQITPVFSFNIGGALIPVAICVYLWVKAGTAKERVRSIVAMLLAGGAVYALSHFLPSEPGDMIVEPNYLYGPVAGLIAWIFGRSRRGAFIAGVMGMLLADVAVAVVMWTQGIESVLRLGGGGAFDAVVLSGLFAVILCETLGEIVERATRGRKRRDMVYENGEFVPLREIDRDGDREEERE